MYIMVIEACTYITFVGWDHEPPYMVYTTQGQKVFLLRHAEWLMGTPVILMGLSNLTGQEEAYSNRTMQLLVCDIGMVVTGALCGFSDSWTSKAIWFTISNTYGLLIYWVALKVYVETYYTIPKHIRKWVVLQAVDFFLLWNIYAIIFPLSTEGFGRVFPHALSSIFYAISDMFAKNIWTFLQWKIRSEFEKFKELHGGFLPEFTKSQRLHIREDTPKIMKQQFHSFLHVLKGGDGVFEYQPYEIPASTTAPFPDYDSSAPASPNGGMGVGGLRTQGSFSAMRAGSFSATRAGSFNGMRAGSFSAAKVALLTDVKRTVAFNRAPGLRTASITWEAPLQRSFSGVGAPMRLRDAAAVEAAAVGGGQPHDGLQVIREIIKERSFTEAPPPPVEPPPVYSGPLRVLIGEDPAKHGAFFEGELRKLPSPALVAPTVSSHPAELLQSLSQTVEGIPYDAVLLSQGTVASSPGLVHTIRITYRLPLALYGANIRKMAEKLQELGVNECVDTPPMGEVYMEHEQLEGLVARWQGRQKGQVAGQGALPAPSPAPRLSAVPLENGMVEQLLQRMQGLSGELNSMRAAMQVAVAGGELGERGSAPFEMPIHIEPFGGSGHLRPHSPHHGETSRAEGFMFGS